MHTKPNVRLYLSTKASHTPDLSCSDPLHTEPAHTRAHARRRCVGCGPTTPRRPAPLFGIASHPCVGANVPIGYGMRQPALSSQAVFPAARFFLRKAGTSVAVASSIASARLMAAEDAPSHLYRSKQASSAFGQMALRSLIHQDSVRPCRALPQVSARLGQSAAWAAWIVVRPAAHVAIAIDKASHHQPPAAIFSQARSSLSRTWLG